MTNLEQLTDLTGVLAIYSYEQSNGAIPIVVIENTQLRQNRDDGIFTWFPGVMVLTQEEVEKWADAFALQFVHIQQQASFLWWTNDLFQDVVIDKNLVRVQLEQLIRTKVIDMREQGLLKQKHGWYMLFQDRLLAWMSYLLEKERDELLGMMKDELGIDIDQRETHISYDDLLALAWYIDKLEVRS